MAGTNTSALPITIFKVKGNSDALPQMRRLLEAASQTFYVGVPTVVASGYVTARSAIDGVTKVVVGISAEAAHNLASSGVAPQGGSGLYYGTVPNQPNAKNIPLGAPMADGACGIYIADENTIFQGVTDDACTLAVTLVGNIYGLTKDNTTGQWFVDTTITAAGSGACVEVLELVDPVGTLAGKVAFRFTNTYQQFGTV